MSPRLLLFFRDKKYLPVYVMFFYEQRVCLICRYVLGVYNSRTEVMKMYDTEMITLQPKVLGKLSEGLICRFEGCDYSHLSLRETSSGPALTVRLKEVPTLSISTKICGGNSLKLGYFYRLFFAKVCPRKFPRKSCEIGRSFYKFVLKIRQHLAFLSTTYQKPWLRDS